MPKKIPNAGRIETFSRENKIRSDVMCLLCVGSFQQLRVASRFTERARPPARRLPNPPSGDGRNRWKRWFVVVLAERSADDHFTAVDDQRLIGLSKQTRLAGCPPLPELEMAQSFRCSGP